MTDTALLSSFGLLLLSLPLVQPTRRHLFRMLRRAWPASFMKRLSGAVNIADAAAVLFPMLLAICLAVPSRTPLLSLGLGSVLVCLILFDLRYRWLPDTLTLPLTLIGILVGALQDHGLWSALTGAMCAGGGAWLLAEGFYRLRGIDGLGGGDVKLMAALGGWCGLELAPLAIASAALAALAVEIPLQLVRQGRLDRARHIPFGAYLATALYGAWLIKATAP
jgi:leader peptidase (prepilin peptidase) / N-methyltransferase